MTGPATVRGHGFALACTALALFSALLFILGLYLLPRPPFPTYNDALRACGNCTSRVAVSLEFENMVIQYGRTTFVPRSLAQVGIGGLVAAPVALLLHSRREDFLRTRNGTARVWGGWIFAAGLLLFLGLGIDDIYYANTGDKFSLAFFVISWAKGSFGNQGFGELGALMLGVAAAGATLTFGLRNAILRIVAPAAFAFSVGLLLFDWKEIAIHATDFLAGLSVNHTDLVSNWTLIAASGLLSLVGALGAARSALSGPGEGTGRGGPAEPQSQPAG